VQNKSSYFPVRVIILVSGEERLIITSRDIPIGREFKVLETNAK
jgi:hypothetical protein